MAMRRAAFDPDKEYIARRNITVGGKVILAGQPVTIEHAPRPDQMRRWYEGRWITRADGRTFSRATGTRREDVTPQERQSVPKAMIPPPPPPAEEDRKNWDEEYSRLAAERALTTAHSGAADALIDAEARRKVEAASAALAQALAEPASADRIEETGRGWYTVYCGGQTHKVRGEDNARLVFDRMRGAAGPAPNGAPAGGYPDDDMPEGE